ncbi:Asp23/Gls24 family envelope stress response protein [Rhodococcus spelaei]|uniref:Asp23/Gls24 family envelope stress response protein n=1 Tax=Rhodococcus spelaei TaxID=2546320 RepID=A0A541B8V0_9NOCA|nr:Asp23/Gls24 family envelope stress response protein [Rhodococcus spelaei]TQF68737.1 Asp23/Gls24 family envelope stress response protein [Rhodococcus spelaei]
MTGTQDPPVEPAERIAALALAVPGVADLHGGMFGEVATYLPGRRLLGVALTEQACAVHIAVTYPGNVVEVAEAVRRAVTPVVTVPVNVTVEDVQLERTAP